MTDYHHISDVKQPDTQGFILNKEPGLGINPENDRFFLGPPLKGGMC